MSERERDGVLFFIVVGSQRKQNHETELKPLAKTPTVTFTGKDEVMCKNRDKYASQLKLGN